MTTHLTGRGFTLATAALTLAAAGRVALARPLGAMVVARPAPSRNSATRLARASHGAAVRRKPAD